MAKKIQLPPTKPSAPAPKKAVKATSEKKIQSVINKGGKVTKTAIAPEDDVLKNFNLKIPLSDLQTINDLRDLRPKISLRKKITVSIQDWMMEAIQEKIERERKTYKL